MSEKNKNGNSKPDDFLRYLRNRMPGRERNAFERMLQQDEFAEEALQGLESISPEKAEKDLELLEKRVKLRTSERRVNWYRIAASVAVLMILSTVFILTERHKKQVKIAYAPDSEQQKEIMETPVRVEKPEAVNNPPITERNTSIKTDVARSTGKPEAVNKGEIRKKGQTEKEIQDLISGGIEPDKDLKEPEKHETVDVSEAVKPGNIKVEAMAAKSAMAKRISQSISVISGKVISAEDNQPIPGASVFIKGTEKGTVTDASGNFKLNVDKTSRTLVANFVGMEPREFKAIQDSTLEIKLEPSSMALSEVVVVGYGTRGADTSGEENPAGYSPPGPVTGKAAYDKYIRDNIKRPDPSTAGQRVVVVTELLVRKDGTTDSLRVIRSPDDIFSEEAIRLIREGPAWKPAVMNGKPIDDKVRVRIVFR